MQDKATILSIDDDADLQFVVKEYLESEGYKVLRAHNLKEFETWRSQANIIDIVLLDLVLQDAEGLSLIGEIHEHIKAPIIVVSGKTDTTEKIVCLEMGADDYLTKPFEMRELAARIKAVLRRSEGAHKSSSDSPSSKPAQGRYKFGSWIMDTDKYQLTDLKGNIIELTTGEFKLLETLVLSAGKVLTRENLFDVTRPDGRYDVYDRAIDIQIARIRKKLAEGSHIQEDLIKTVRGVGYMLTSKVEAVA
ncbi:MAG: response regulator transcription factor [Pseudobdellovibrionaceae bacterium]|jgi:DNA-binding response OmpR family regulator|nr:response regulator transcription factor [Pseudobdellovibrionaceae bacterium]